MKSTVPNHASGDRKKIALIILVTIALVAIIVALIYNLTSDKDGASPVSESAGAGQESLADNGADAPDMQTQIEDLIGRYRTAFAGADIEALKTIYNTDEVKNSDVIQAASKIITGYENTTCHIKDGLDETSKVVFICDDLKVDGIDTRIPNIAYVYVRQNSDGSYYIYPGEYDPASSDYVYSSDIQKYISEMIKDEDISALYASVNERMAAAIEADPQVRAFVEELTGDAAESAAETGAAAGETDGGLTPAETGSQTSGALTDTAGQESDSGALSDETLEGSGPETGQS